MMKQKVTWDCKLLRRGKEKYTLVTEMLDSKWSLQYWNSSYLMSGLSSNRISMDSTGTTTTETRKRTGAVFSTVTDVDYATPTTPVIARSARHATRRVMNPRTANIPTSAGIRAKVILTPQWI